MGGGNRVVQNAHVRDGARFGEAGLLAAGVEGLVEHFGLVHVALEPGLVLGSGREFLELPGGDLDALVQLILAELELLHQGLGVDRDRLGSERVDLLDQIADLPFLLGVPRSQPAQLGLRRGELAQDPLEVGRLPHGVDGVEGVDGHLPPLGAAQHLLDVTAVAADRVQAAALREVRRVHGRLGERQPRCNRRFLSGQRHGSYPEPFQSLLRSFQPVGLAHDLGVQNLSQQGQLLALLGRGLVDIASDEGVHDRSRLAGALVAQPEDEEVVLPQRGDQPVGELDRGLSRRDHLEAELLVATAWTDPRRPAPAELSADRIAQGPRLGVEAGLLVKRVGPRCVVHHELEPSRHELPGQLEVLEHRGVGPLSDVDEKLLLLHDRVQDREGREQLHPGS